MQGLLQKKNIHISAKRYFIDALGAMAYGLFASLLVGTILNSLGQVFHIPFLTDVIWPIAQKAAGPAMAVAIGMALQAPSLVLYAATLVGFAGNDLVGQLGTLEAMAGQLSWGSLFFNILLLHIVLPGAVTYSIYYLMKKQGLIQAGDMKLDMG